MMIKYWLFVIFMGQMQVAGPFDGLIACERAASQVVIASIETSGWTRHKATATCLSQKHHDFKYKEPKR